MDKNIPEKMTGSLFIVATPIGHPDDITLRAVKILKQVSSIIVESFKQGSKTLRSIGISGKEMIELNEHNEKENSELILHRMLIEKDDFALISDCGTPVFSDPGHFLIEKCSQMDIPIIPIPGVSSLTTAMSILGFNLKKFYFAGFLSQKSDLRQKELKDLKQYKIPIILMDTPYRLMKLLEEIKKSFGPNKQVTLACDLTLPSEKIYRGKISQVIPQIQNRKAEFILFLH